MSAAVVAHRPANVRRDRVEMGDELLDCFLFQASLAGQRLVEVGDVGGVMFAVVYFHGERVDIRFERVLGIGESR